MTEREFETLVREHRSTIYTVCYMFSTDKDEVADLFQEILINLWLGILIWDVVKNLQLGGPELYGFLCGASIGLVAGLVLGLKNRRDILDASDDLLGQIEELKG